MVQNNLPPESQQWVRDLEKRITDLEKSNSVNAEFQRNSSAIYGGLASTVASVQAQQQTIAVNTRVDTINAPSRETNGTSFSTEILSAADLESATSGIVTATLIPLATATGQSSVTGTCTATIYFSGGMGSYSLQTELFATPAGSDGSNTALSFTLDLWRSVEYVDFAVQMSSADNLGVVSAALLISRNVTLA